MTTEHWYSKKLRNMTLDALCAEIEEEVDADAAERARTSMDDLAAELRDIAWDNQFAATEQAHQYTLAQREEMLGIAETYRMLSAELRRRAHEQEAA